MSLEYAWSIRQFNTAVNIVRYDEGRPTVELINGTAHLASCADGLTFPQAAVEKIVEKPKKFLDEQPVFE